MRPITHFFLRDILYNMYHVINITITDYKDNDVNDEFELALHSLILPWKSMNVQEGKIESDSVSMI